MKTDTSSEWFLLPLSARGIEHFSSELTSERGLALRLVPKLIADGQVDGFVPKGTTLERALEFHTGGLATAATSEKVFSDRVRSLLSIDPKRVFVVQDVWAEESDVNKDFSQNFASEGCVYYFCKSQGTAADISNVLRQPLSFKILAGIFEPSSELTLGPVAKSQIDALANSIVELYLSAYDQESFLVWHR